METSKQVMAKVPGIITIVSAVAIVVFHALQGHPLDSYILPFILLMSGIGILNKRSGEETRLPEMRKSTGRIVVATISISLIAGIVVMLLAMV